MVLVLSPHKYTVGVWMVAFCNVLHHSILIVAVCFYKLLHDSFILFYTCVWRQINDLLLFKTSVTKRFFSETKRKL